VLDFFRAEITAEDVEHALTMPGGGTWNVAPGQVTDDGELTMSLLNALAQTPDRPPSTTRGGRPPIRSTSASPRATRWPA